MGVNLFEGGKAERVAAALESLASGVEFTKEVVVVQDDTPTSNETKIWFPETEPTGIQVATMDDLETRGIPDGGASGKVLAKASSTDYDVTWADPPSPTDTQVTTAVDAYLAENFTNPDSPPLDRTLASSESAAPADLVGDLKSAFDLVSDATVEKIVVSDNQWNDDAATDGKYYYSDGSILDNANYALSDFIPINGKAYVLACSKYGTSPFAIQADGLAFFDEDKTFVTGSRVTSISAAVSVPVSAVYVRVYFQKILTQKYVGVSDSSTLPTYDEYAIELKNLLKERVETLETEAEETGDKLDYFYDEVFTEVKPNLLRFNDIPETTESGITYKLTGNYLEISGTTSAAVTIEIPLINTIGAGNYYYTNFMTYATGIVPGTFSLVTTANDYITLTGSNEVNKAVTVPSGKTVNKLSIYFGSGRLETSTYKLCLTDYALPTPAVYPDDHVILSDDMVELLNERYDKNSYPSNRVMCWGDSLTDGSATYSYPGKLQTKITNGGNSMTVENGGQGGETSLQISFRQGSIVLQAKPVTIPASGSVEIEVDKWNQKTITILTRGGAYVTYDNPHLLINPVTIKGVTGTLLRNSDGDIIFTRSASGSAVSFDRPQDIIVKAQSAYNLPTDVTVIWAGTNDTLWDIDQTITTIQNMIATLANEKYIVVGMTAKYHFSDIEDRNFAMANAFGKHFLNVRDYILAYGLTDAGITPDTQDETDIANGEIPHDLRVDTIHFNEAGYTIIADQIYKKGQKLGYWN